MTQHRQVYQYEVELKLTNPNTREVTLVTRIEPAYSPFDAWMQAIIGTSTDAGSADIKLVHVRPTADAIAASQQGLAAVISDALAGLVAHGSKAPR